MSKKSDKNANASAEDEIISYYRQPNSMNDTVRKFGLANRYQLKKILAKYGIAEHSEKTKRALQKNNREKTCLAKYGVRCTFSSEDPSINGKAAMAEKYGVEHPLQSTAIFDKMTQTKIERYGNANYNNATKAKDTRLKKYGRANVGEFGSPEHDKAMIEKYGVSNPLKNESLKQKAEQTLFEHYGVRHPSENKELNEKRRQTMLSRYGVEGMLQKPEYYQKAKDGLKKKYGVDNAGELQCVKEKISET